MTEKRLMETRLRRDVACNDEPRMRLNDPMRM